MSRCLELNYRRLNTGCRHARSAGVDRTLSATLVRYRQISVAFDNFRALSATALRSRCLTCALEDFKYASFLIFVGSGGVCQLAFVLPQLSGSFFSQKKSDII